MCLYIYIYICICEQIDPCSGYTVKCLDKCIHVPVNFPNPSAAAQRHCALFSRCVAWAKHRHGVGGLEYNYWSMSNLLLMGHMILCYQLVPIRSIYVCVWKICANSVVIKSYEAFTGRNAHPRIAISFDFLVPKLLLDVSAQQTSGSSLERHIQNSTSVVRSGGFSWLEQLGFSIPITRPKMV